MGTWKDVVALNELVCAQCSDYLTYSLPSCALFADDTIIYRAIYNNLDEVLVQRDLDTLALWCNQNEMALNSSKTKVLHITRSHNPLRPTYVINNASIQRVQSHTYLGITLNHKLTWNDHVGAITSKANRMLGFIASTAGGASPKAKFHLYRALVVPVLEYGIPAWQPYTATLSDSIEKIQRRATRLALGQRRGEMEYSARLSKLHWPLLSVCRQFLLISFVCKVLLCLIDCESISNSIQISTCLPRHLETLCFKHLKGNHNCLHKSGIYIFPRLWEGLPNELKNSLILDPFTTFIVKLKRCLYAPSAAD